MLCLRSKSTDLAIPFSSEYVEATLGVDNQFLHMEVGGDPTPSYPPRSLLDYTHPAGEIYDNLETEDGSNAVFCPGRENQLCSAGVLVPNILGRSFLLYLA